MMFVMMFIMEIMVAMIPMIVMMIESPMIIMPGHHAAGEIGKANNQGKQTQNNSHIVFLLSRA
jgi:hypothetical protein